MKETKNKVKLMHNDSDIDNLKAGDKVDFAKFGEMLYHGKIDGLHIFWGRDKRIKESIRELWFKREQLSAFNGQMGSRVGYIEQNYYNVVENRKPWYQLRDKSLLEAGI